MSLLEIPPPPADADRPADGGQPAPGGPAEAEPAPRRADGLARAAAWLAVLAVIGSVFTVASGEGFAPGQFARVAAGTVELRQGRDWHVVPVGEGIPAGATLRSRDERAELEVRGGALSLSRFAELTVEGERVALGRGELLFEAARTYLVTVGAVEGRGRGDWRVSASGLPRYAVYAGGAAVTGPEGGTVEIAALREVAVDGGLARDVVPLRYVRTDPWDQRLMAEAIRVDDLLGRTQRALRNRYGTARQPEAFYADFLLAEGFRDELPRLAVQAGPDGVGPPAETLVAVVVADLLVTRAGLTTDEAAEGIDRLRTAGATWGLIVVEHGLAASDLDARLDLAIRQRSRSVEEGTATPARPTEPDAGPPTTPPSTPPPDERRDRDDGTDGPGDPTPPEPDEPDEPDEPGEDPPGTLDPVQEPIDDVGSLLDEVVPGASEVTDTVNDGIDTVDDLLP